VNFSKTVRYHSLNILCEVHYVKTMFWKVSLCENTMCGAILNLITLINLFLDRADSYSAGSPGCWELSRKE
jgi:hypothetical protein